MKKLVFIIVCLIGLTHCSSYDFRQAIVQQGNLLPESKINRLKIGMTKSDVQQLMGTSMIYPVFSSNRWDYAYTKRKGFSKQQESRLVLYFSNGRLNKIEHNAS